MLRCSGCNQSKVHQMNKLLLTVFAAVLLAGLSPFVSAEQPFAVAAQIQPVAGGERELLVSFSIPEGNYIYADEIKVEATAGAEIVSTFIPAPIEKNDDAGGGGLVKVYAKSVVLRYAVKNVSGKTVVVRVQYRGCGERTCYFRQTKNFELSVGFDRNSGGVARSTSNDDTAVTGTAAVADAAVAAIPVAGDVFKGISAPGLSGQSSWVELASGFTITGKKDGYMNRSQFLAFLDGVESGMGVEQDSITKAFARGGWWVILGLLLAMVGGLGLNLTPCVLPMIPINIAIIGAGSRAGSRRRGFALGAAYGGAMALVYGVLGLVVIKTGVRFGGINASPVFNGAVAVVFLALALAMFGVFNLDFSRFQTAASGKRTQGRGQFLAAFAMGGLSALLAGACVAPAVVSVLLISVKLCDGGVCIWLLLPFMLGVGMGLPWPFLGAGLSFLPKPGRWMSFVKYAFGVFILGFAVYQGVLAFKLYKDSLPADAAIAKTLKKESMASGWTDSLSDGLALAAAVGKPVLVDLWAEWCKNCLAMDNSTLRDPEVTRRLEGYVKVKFDATDQEDPEVAAVQKYFSSLGLPTFAVLKPKGSDGK